MQSMPGSECTFLSPTKYAKYVLVYAARQAGSIQVDLVVAFDPPFRAVVHQGTREEYGVAGPVVLVSPACNYTAKERHSGGNSRY